jgi:hypothetical protein
VVTLVSTAGVRIAGSFGHHGGLPKMLSVSLLIIRSESPNLLRDRSGEFTSTFVCTKQAPSYS